MDACSTQAHATVYRTRTSSSKHNMRANKNENIVFSHPNSIQNPHKYWCCNVLYLSAFNNGFERDLKGPRSVLCSSCTLFFVDIQKQQTNAPQNALVPNCTSRLELPAHKYHPTRSRPHWYYHRWQLYNVTLILSLWSNPSPQRRGRRAKNGVAAYFSLVWCAITCSANSQYPSAADFK